MEARTESSVKTINVKGLNKVMVAPALFTQEKSPNKLCIFSVRHMQTEQLKKSEGKMFSFLNSHRRDFLKRLKNTGSICWLITLDETIAQFEGMN